MDDARWTGLIARISGLLLCAVLWTGSVGAADEVEPGDYIHYRLGVNYKREKNYDLAIEEFRKVLAAYPDNYNAYMHLAEIRSELDQPRLVVYNAKQALAYNPGWGRAHQLLASAYEADRQYQNAIVEYQLYQQTCDPAVRDSIQQHINSLVKRVAGQSPPAVTDPTAAGPKAAAGVAEPAAPKSVPAKPHVTNAAHVSPAQATKADAEFQTAVQLYGEKRFDESLEHLKACLVAQPGHAGAYYYGGLIRRRLGQNDKARINFEKALTYPELGYNAHFYLGKICGDNKEYAAAIRHFEEYLKASSYDAGKDEARSLIQTYKGLAGSTPEAARTPKVVVVDVKSIGEADLKSEVETITPEAPQQPIEVRIDSLLSMIILDTLTDRGQALLKGVRLFKDGKYDDAVREFRQVQAAYPTGETSLHCVYDIGICYMKLRLYSAAENQFQQVLDRFPNHAYAAQSRFLKAFSYGERRESATAEKLYREFIGMHRTHPWVGKAYEKLGDAYIDLEQPRKAVDAYAQAVKVAANPSDKVYAYFKEATSYVALDNAERAVESFGRAIETGESQGVYERVPDSYYRMADCYYKKKAYDKAQGYYQGAVRKYPGFQETPWGMFQVANIYKNTRQYRKAVDTYKKLMEKFPDDYWARQAQWKLEDTVWENEYQAALR